MFCLFQLLLDFTKIILFIFLTLFSSIQLPFFPDLSDQSEIFTSKERASSTRFSFARKQFHVTSFSNFRLFIQFLQTELGRQTNHKLGNCNSNDPHSFNRGTTSFFTRFVDTWCWYPFVDLNIRCLCRPSREQRYILRHSRRWQPSLNKYQLVFIL